LAHGNGPRCASASTALRSAPAGLSAQVAALAGPDLLRLPERQAATEEEVFGAVVTWLRENPGWLLILDNVDTEEAARAVQDLLPKLQGGKVLVTSRLADWPAELGTQEVKRISQEEAVRFLLERTQKKRHQTPADPADAARLSSTACLWRWSRPELTSHSIACPWPAISTPGTARGAWSSPGTTLE
jgi:hypothetical protein